MMSYRQSEIYRLGFEQALLAEEECRKFPKHELFAREAVMRRSSGRNLLTRFIYSTRLPSMDS
jgi:hypothetical protein